MKEVCMVDYSVWFDRLYKEHSARLFKQAFYILQDRYLAEDLVDEAFMLMLSKKKDLIKHPNIGGWLSLTVMHLMRDELKSARHRLEVPYTYDENVPAPQGHQPLAEILPKGLRPKEREILILLYEEQLSYEEIAARLGISLINCRTRAFRAKKHCRDLLGKEK